MDFGVTYDGMITDAAFTKIAGKTQNPKHERLLSATQSSLMASISVLKDSVKVGDIANAIESLLRNKYGIVRDLVGHGVGHKLHEDPNIPNYGKSGTGPSLSKGMTIAIEPMATLGKDDVYVESDGWTVRTIDGSMAAHFEHTVLITKDGYEILTKI
jgi:methionyl aminopeptidase